ncbi:MAG: dioxygenase [Pseudomonadota bacterium]
MAQPAEQLDKTHPRVKAIVEDLVDAISDVFAKHNVTFPEYRAGFFHVIKTGKAGELGLLMDMLLCQRVCDLEMEGRKGTRSNVEGPYYLPDAPFVTDVVKVHDHAEPMQIEATVRDTNGNPIPDVDVELWWADPEGFYSGYRDDYPKDFYRCRTKTDANGQYSIRGSLPKEYPITKAVHGPTGSLIELLGRQGMRTMHVHQKYNHAGFLPLTTQAYFEGAAYLDADPVTAVFDDLTYKLKERDGVPVLSLDIVLDRAS